MPIVLQLGLMAIGGSTLLFVPPVEGAMLLVPVNGYPVTTVNAALASGARLVGAGPLPGSMIVVGRRDAVAPAVLATGALILAARAKSCGEALTT